MISIKANYDIKIEKRGQTCSTFSFGKLFDGVKSSDLLIPSSFTGYKGFILIASINKNNHSVIIQCCVSIVTQDSNAAINKIFTYIKGGLHNILLFEKKT